MTKASAARPKSPPPAAKNLPLPAVNCSAPRFNSLANCCPRHRLPRHRRRPSTALAATLKQSLTDLVDQDEHGRPRLTFALPDAAALDNLTHVLARLLAQTQPA